jgi:hypothetical protein
MAVNFSILNPVCNMMCNLLGYPDVYIDKKNIQCIIFLRVLNLNFKYELQKLGIARNRELN